MQARAALFFASSLALCLALAHLTACGDAPAPVADTPVTAPADTPTPASPPAEEPAPIVVDNSGPVPMRFQGEWNREPADCGSGINDSRLVIGPDSMTFHETSGLVVQVAEEGSDMQVTVQLSSETGEIEEKRFAYRLSPDGRSLSDLGGAGMVRQRCPS